MFSFFKKVVSSVLPWGSEFPMEDLEEGEQEIINRIRCMSTGNSEIQEYAPSEQQKSLGQSDVQYEVEVFKCVHKIGKVTHLCNEYGIIDDVIYFEPHQVSLDLILKPNDVVIYSAYKAKENEAERVFKIYGLKNESWESNLPLEPGYQTYGVQGVEEIPAIKRVITGRVTQRRGREVYIESANIWCNLDKIETSYIPIEGDWIEMRALVSICEDVADLSGEIMEIKSIKPLLTKSGWGRITFWSDLKSDGAIENFIYFSIMSCEEGYVPNLGDEVFYDAIESDQDRFRWRALNVLVRNTKSEMKDIDKRESNDALLINFIDPFCDKNGISIVPCVCSVEVELNQAKTVVFEVTNNGQVRHLLKYTRFQTSNKTSQLKLLSPKLSDYFFLYPKQSVQYHFQCEGKILGLSGEIFFFYFKNFLIAKRFEINVVGDREMNKLLECKFDTVVKVFNKRKFIKSDCDAEVVLRGPRPWKPPKFVSRERKCTYNVPKTLWSIMVESSNGLKGLKTLMEYAPCLKTDLNFIQYADRFHTLLHLEEIELKVNFRKYDMSGVFLLRNDDFFVIDVPGLVEKRPSVIVGDKIILSQSWCQGGKTNHIGFIHHIEARKIFVKFHESFHQTYDESECDIFFEPNTNFFTRSHEAINRAIKTLGEQWLFPSAVNEKPPQIDFDIREEVETLPENVASFFKQISKIHTENKSLTISPKVTDIETCSKYEFCQFVNKPIKKSLVWANKNLNDRQKLAVINVLQGRGRPLPYIIFGPPGTGKTVTLVEIITQIYRLMPESRILVTTPSNSSADLICERLIDLGNFKPGQLVRLVALYRVFEGLVPPKLVPYSTFFQGKDSGGKSQCEGNFKSNIRGSSGNELPGKHRITIATCVTIGLLHYLGLPEGHFTHILVDEAGQTSEPEVLITATFQNSLNGQVILTGDPQQLGPVVYSKVAKGFGLGVSLLQRLISTFPYARDFDGFPKTSGFDPRFITKLNVNYRSVPEILSLPGQLFYNSDLIPTVSQTNSEEARIIEKFNFEIENRPAPPAIIFHGLIGQNYQESDSPSWFNPHEVWQVVFYVRKLYSIGLKNDDIGIVSPYSKQVQKLKTLLPSLELSIPKIGSVEEFQGQERYVIIVSTVRSCPKYVRSDINHSLGFVASPQRLNVALTRARALLIIIGNPILLSEDPYWSNVVKYCLKNNSYTGCSLDTFSQNVKDEDDSNAQQITEETTDVNSRVSDEAFREFSEHYLPAIPANFPSRMSGKKQFCSLILSERNYTCS